MVARTHLVPQHVRRSGMPSITSDETYYGSVLMSGIVSIIQRLSGV